MQYFIKGNYYFDIDNRNQMRLTGPQNHLLMGLSFPPKSKIKILYHDIRKNGVIIKLRISKKIIKTAIPVVTDIRTIRALTESKNPKPLFSSLVNSGIEDVTPSIIKRSSKGLITSIKFINKYFDEFGKSRTYGVRISFPKTYKLLIDRKAFQIKSSNFLEFTIESISNIPIIHRIKKVSFSESEILTSKFISPFLKKLYRRSYEEISHLLKAQKTSSFEYGTVFPRDWIESADLGEGDLSKSTIDYMYTQAMKHISDIGEAWHEEIVGAYKEKVRGKIRLVDRKMIDIEPHYILGMNYISKKMLLNPEAQNKLRLVAHYILNKAQEHDLITFKRIDDLHQDYYKVGDWRDSAGAFPGHKSPLAPYDVNCVFYPECLRVIKKYHEFFQIKDVDQVDKLIAKWNSNKQKFRMYHPGDIVGYAIALHGKKNKPLPVSHIDESYDLFYNYPSMEDVFSFAVRLIDPEFFYTPVGPILVANDEDDFNSQQYHGKVIWPKQAAFAIAGLSRQFRRGLNEGWPNNILIKISESILKTCEACFKGWKDMKVVPELYWYDADLNKAKLYTDQESYEGPMSVVQLWSSVGLRRILKEYHYIKGIN